MAKIVDVIISDQTNAVAQAGYKSVVLMILDEDISAQTISSIDEATGLSATATLEASAFFAGGGTELKIIGKDLEDATGTTETNMKKLFATAINAFDFYGVIVDKGGVGLTEVEILKALKTEIEGNKKVLLYEIDGSYNTVISGVGGELDDSTRITSDRVVIYGRSASSSGGISSGVAGFGFKTNPGSISWGNNVIPGLSNSAYALLDENNFKANHINYISNVLGLNITQYGRTLSGKELEDIRLEDAIAGAIREDLTQFLINSSKVPFTSSGLASIQAVLSSTAQGFVNNGGLSSYTVSVPSVEDIPATDIANHTLTNVKMEVVLAGSIETITVNVIVKLKGGE